MGDTKTEILEAVKLLLEIDDDGKDELLMLMIEDTINAVLSYCRIEVLPRQLVSFIPAIAAENYRSRENGGIKVITEGERRVEYLDGNYDFLSAYESRLKPFVSRKVYVPSELYAERSQL